jgi:hypothetical protein
LTARRCGTWQEKLTDRGGFFQLLHNIRQPGKAMLSVLIVTWPEERSITTPVLARAYGNGTNKKRNGISIFVAT